MSLESATWISDLDAANPVSTDKKKQGDDHLRLIKSVLKTSLPTAGKAFYFPTASSSQTANFAVVAADMNKTFMIDTTSGAITATLPTLAAGDAGWECSFIKTNTGTNPYFIAPPSGTIQSGELTGLAKTRRCIPGYRSRALWTGSAWIAERVVRQPVGSIVDWPVASQPVGYELAGGQSIGSSANYPDYFAVFGVMTAIDRRGTAAFGRDNMQGVAANRVTTAGSGIDGTLVGSVGGSQNVSLLRSHLPNELVGVTLAGTATVPYATASTTNGVTAPFTYVSSIGSGGSTGSTLDLSVAASGTFFLNGGVTQTPLNKMPPAAITNILVVVE